MKSSSISLYRAIASHMGEGICQPRREGKNVLPSEGRKGLNTSLFKEMFVSQAGALSEESISSLFPSILSSQCRYWLALSKALPAPKPPLRSALDFQHAASTALGSLKQLVELSGNPSSVHIDANADRWAEEIDTRKCWSVKCFRQLNCLDCQSYASKWGSATNSPLHQSIRARSSAVFKCLKSFEALTPWDRGTCSMSQLLSACQRVLTK